MGECIHLVDLNDYCSECARLRTPPPPTAAEALAVGTKAMHTLIKEESRWGASVVLAAIAKLIVP